MSLRDVFVGRTSSRTAMVAAPAIVAAITGAAVAGPNVRITQLCGGGQNINAFVPGAANSWTINAINSLAVNNAGQWYVEVENSATPNRSAAVINLLGTNTILSEHWAAGYLQSGNPGETWVQRGLHTIGLNNAGAVIRNIRITNVVNNPPIQDTSGNLGLIYLNNSIVLRGTGFLNGATTFVTGDTIGNPWLASFTTPPVPTWGKDTFSQWQDDCIVRINDSNQVAMLANFDLDPATGGNGSQAIVRLQLDASGALQSTTLIMKIGDPIPGVPGRTVASFCGNPGTATSSSVHRMQINSAGQIIYSVDDGAGGTYLMVNQTVVARQGDISPVDITYGSLSGVPCDINDNGQWAMRAPLSDGSAVVVKSFGGTGPGAPSSMIAWAGGFAAITFPDISPATLQECGKPNGAIKLDNSGHVLWWGRFNAASSNGALFQDNQVLVRQGATFRVNGTRVGATAPTDGVSTTQVGLDFDADQFDMSRNGRYVIFKTNAAASSPMLTANLMEICQAGDAVCNNVSGACCTVSGCSIMTPAACSAAQGIYAGNFAPCITCPLTNDECAGATVVNTGENIGTTIGATTSFTIAPSTLCGPAANAGGANDVFHRYTAPIDGPYELNTCGTTFDTVLSIHTACPADSSNLLLCNDDSTANTACAGNGLASRIPAATLTHGVTYFIRVAGYNGATGDYTLTIIAATPACPVDYDQNGQIQPADVAAFVSAWFTSLQNGTLVGDFDHNGSVQPADVASFVAAWFNALNNGC